ncbi:MAG: hypothetical protein HQ539_03095 [Parcubacteria group bacterium]|nr:hypothetical protein [Parcubacteria group bacterium]
MPHEDYVFQKRKASFTKKIFGKGLNASAYVLLNMKESGEDFLNELPSSYPGFALLKVMFGVNGKKPPFKKNTVRVNLNRLEKQGLIAKSPKEKVYLLTDKGKEFTSYIKNRFAILKEKWDGKFRLVIFDVPEAKKHWREVIRNELILMQYQLLQKSVYIGKYPLSKTFIKELEKKQIADYLFIFTVDQVDRRQEILKLLDSIS